MDANMKIPYILAAIISPVTPFSAIGLNTSRRLILASKKTPIIMPNTSQKANFMY